MKSAVDRKKDGIFEKVKRLGLPLGEYVVVGGAMEAHGIRKAKDIDIVVTDTLFRALRNQGWKEGTTQLGLKKAKLKNGEVDVFSDYSCGEKYQANTVKLIKNADVINGIPFVQLEELVKWKKTAAREKDLEDVELIERFLQAKKS